MANGGVAACDLELVDQCTEAEWRDVLGPARWELAEAIARASAGGGQDAGALVWVAGECVVKAGMPPTTLLSIRSVEADGWVCIAAGPNTVASVVLRGGVSRPDLAVGVLVESGSR